MNTQFDVKVTVKDLFVFLLNNTYRKFSGILILLFSIACVVIVICTWGDVKLSNSILLLVLAAFYLVFNPIILYGKAGRQVENNDYFKNSLTYYADNTGITVSFGEEKSSTNWNEMWKAVKYGSIVVIYVTTIRAFILPISCIGDKYNDFVDLASGGLGARCRLRKKK